MSAPLSFQRPQVDGIDTAHAHMLALLDIKRLNVEKIDTVARGISPPHVLAEKTSVEKMLQEVDASTDIGISIAFKKMWARLQHKYVKADDEDRGLGDERFEVGDPRSTAERSEICLAADLPAKLCLDDLVVPALDEAEGGVAVGEMHDDLKDEHIPIQTVLSGIPNITKKMQQLREFMHTNHGQYVKADTDKWLKELQTMLVGRDSALETSVLNFMAVNMAIAHHTEGYNKEEKKWEGVHELFHNGKAADRNRTRIIPQPFSDVDGSEPLPTHATFFLVNASIDIDPKMIVLKKNTYDDEEASHTLQRISKVGFGVTQAIEFMQRIIHRNTPDRDGVLPPGDGLGARLIPGLQQAAAEDSFQQWLNIDNKNKLTATYLVCVLRSRKNPKELHIGIRFVPALENAADYIHQFLRSKSTRLNIRAQQEFVETRREKDDYRRLSTDLAKQQYDNGSRKLFAEQEEQGMRPSVLAHITADDIATSSVSGVTLFRWDKHATVMQAFVRANVLSYNSFVNIMKDTPVLIEFEKIEHVEETIKKFNAKEYRDITKMAQLFFSSEDMTLKMSTEGSNATVAETKTSVYEFLLKNSYNLLSNQSEHSMIVQVASLIRAQIASASSNRKIPFSTQTIEQLRKLSDLDLCALMRVLISSDIRSIISANPIDTRAAMHNVDMVMSARKLASSRENYKKRSLQDEMYMRSDGDRKRSQGTKPVGFVADNAYDSAIIMTLTNNNMLLVVGMWIALFLRKYAGVFDAIDDKVRAPPLNLQVDRSLRQTIYSLFVSYEMLSGLTSPEEIEMMLSAVDINVLGRMSLALRAIDNAGLGLSQMLDVVRMCLVSVAYSSPAQASTSIFNAYKLFRQRFPVVTVEGNIINDDTYQKRARGVVVPADKDPLYSK